jgi:hypothetical protein
MLTGSGMLERHIVTDSAGKYPPAVKHLWVEEHLAQQRHFYTTQPLAAAAHQWL